MRYVAIGKRNATGAQASPLAGAALALSCSPTSEGVVANRNAATGRAERGCDFRLTARRSDGADFK